MCAFFESVGKYRHHVLVVTAHELISRADKQLHVVDLGPRLIEALAQVLQAEKDKVHCRSRGDAYGLTFFEFAGPAGVVGYVCIADLCHELFPPAIVGRSQLAAFVKVVDEATGHQITNEARLHEALGRDTGRQRTGCGNLF